MSWKIILLDSRLVTFVIISLLVSISFCCWFSFKSSLMMKRCILLQTQHQINLEKIGSGKNMSLFPSLAYSILVTAVFLDFKEFVLEFLSTLISFHSVSSPTTQRRSLQ